MERRHLVYLALADGRGHLMRAHLIASALEAAGVRVDLVTTRIEGAHFLHALGHEGVHVLPGGLHVPYNGADLDLRGADRETRNYLANPRRYLVDIRVLALLTRGADLVINDSFHPAATWLSLSGRRPVAFVHAEHVRRVTCSRLRGPVRVLMQRALDQAPQLEASLDPRAPHQLPPIFDIPVPITRGARPLAAIYLNPNLAEVGRARALVETLERRGYEVRGVGPSVGGAGEQGPVEAGLCPVDARLVDTIAASELIVAGPGAATCSQALAFNIPLVALLGHQPEQLENVRTLDRRGHPVFPIDVHGDVPRALDVAAKLASWIPTGAPFALRRAQALAIRQMWTARVLAFIDNHGERDHAQRAYFGNTQPQARPGGRRRRPIARALARALAEADTSPRRAA